MNRDGSVAPLDYSEDGTTPGRIFFKGKYLQNGQLFWIWNLPLAAAYHPYKNRMEDKWTELIRSLFFVFAWTKDIVFCLF